MPCARRIAALLALAAVPAGADPAAGPLRLADLSARLYAAGLAEGDAILIATAARLRRDAGLPADLPGDLVPDWTAMLATAETLAAGDPALLDLIADLRAETVKGIISGPEYRRAALDARASETLPPLAFKGGDYAEVYVEAASGTDVNLTILDAAGHVVCTDTDRSHVAYCGWTPAADGDFTVVIDNLSPIAADYALMTN